MERVWVGGARRSLLQVHRPDDCKRAFHLPHAPRCRPVLTRSFLQFVLPSPTFHSAGKAGSFAYGAVLLQWRNIVADAIDISLM